MSAPTNISRICAAMARYYAFRNTEYNANFTVYCDENGLNDDEIAAELAESPTDCLLVDFDPDFPTPEDEEENKQQFIYDLIQDCLNNPDISFCKTPNFGKDAFNMNEENLTEIEEIYKIQCPVLYNSGMNIDKCFKQILWIGHKYQFDYLQHLVSDYWRDRIKNMDKFWTVKKWKKDHKHFIKLSKMQIKQEKQPCDIVEHAVKAFDDRCCPKLTLNPRVKINSSFEITCLYILASFTFISNLIFDAENINRGICPFQVDICIATGKPTDIGVPVIFNTNKNDTNNDQDDDEDDDDDDDDDDDEKKIGFVDCIGDIKGKLKKNGLKYLMDYNDTSGQRPLRVFTQIFNKFKEDNKLSHGTNKQYCYPHRKRVIAFVDRRGAEQNDPVFVYEPPANCSTIPKDAVPEWYLSSSKTCLLPNMEYGDGSKAEDPDNNTKKQNNSSEKLKKANIGSSFHCKGALLTLSFHIKQIDVKKCFLYWNGQIIRFMPQDIKTVLPTIFNMNYQENKFYFQQKDEINHLIKKINDIWNGDKYFKKFTQNL